MALNYAIANSTKNISLCLHEEFDKPIKVYIYVHIRMRTYAYLHLLV